MLSVRDLSSLKGVHCGCFGAFSFKRVDAINARSLWQTLKKCLFACAEKCVGRGHLFFECGSVHILFGWTRGFTFLSSRRATQARLRLYQVASANPYIITSNTERQRDHNGRFGSTFSRAGTMERSGAPHLKFQLIYTYQISYNNTKLRRRRKQEARLHQPMVLTATCTSCTHSTESIGGTMRDSLICQRPGID